MPSEFEISVEEQFVQDVKRVLSKKYATYQEARLGASFPGDATFHGYFRGVHGLWLVSLIYATREALDTSRAREIVSAVNSIPGMQFNGLLIVLPNISSQKKSEVLSLFAQHNLQVRLEIVTFLELEITSHFDNFVDDYPGEIALIGHSSDAYHKTIELLDQVRAKLTTANDTGLTADVRNRLLVEVEAGRTLLSATTVRVASLAHSVVPALKFIAENCARAIVGELAKKALLELVKLAFGN